MLACLLLVFSVLAEGRAGSTNQDMGKWGIDGGVMMFSALLSFPSLIMLQILFYC